MSEEAERPLRRGPWTASPVAILCVAASLATTGAAAGPIAGGAETAETAGHPTRIPTVDALVQQPRPFGYVVGDLVEQRILLQAQGRVVDPTSLPAPGRLGIWLERRAPKVTVDPDGRRWLIVDYQLVNAPQGLTTVNLPAWELASQEGGPSLRVPQWPISVAALTGRTVIAQGGLQELRADRPAPLIPTQPILRRLQLWLGALALTLGAWLAWIVVRNWRASSNQPFARAARELHRLDEASPEAWQALHRAFDSAAGKVLQGGTLPVLFERVSYLEPLRPRIQEFFAQSADLFFGEGLRAKPISLRELSAELLRLERRNER